jgi:predicted amidophosphoribosyltransferase
MTGKEHKVEREHHFCPYCDEELAEVSFPYCQACVVTIFYCPQCREPLPRDKRVCPHCGAEIKGKET